MKAVLLDTVTGETFATSGEMSQSAPFWWQHGNGSCDCNRETLFGRDTVGDTCIGSHRYLIIAAEFEPGEDHVSLRDLNPEYPEELLTKHLPSMNIPAPQASKLPSTYDTALLGASVSTVEPDRFVYSLRGLIQLVMLERQCQPPEAREVILAEMIKPFGAEIVFVNDELVEPVEDPKPKIIVPKKVGNRRWQ